MAPEAGFLKEPSCRSLRRAEAWEEALSSSNLFLFAQTSMLKLRLDRLVSVHVGHPIAQLLNGHRKTRVPILLYHCIAHGTGGWHPYYELNTSPEMFACQMKFLYKNGYSALSLDDAMNFLGAGGTEKRCVVMTFDDGYRDFYTDAYPVLARYGFTATVFLVTGLIKVRRSECDGTEYMTWSEVRELHSHGIRIGSHTVTHPELRCLSPAGIDYEVRYSKETIEDKIGDSVKSFSYPFAFPEDDKKFTRYFTDTLENCGYESGVSTIIGRAGSRDTRFFLPRLPVNSWDDLCLFQAKLDGGYDWLHAVQYAAKVVRAKIS